MDYNIMTVQYQLQQSSFQRDRLRRKLKRLKTQLTYENPLPGGDEICDITILHPVPERLSHK